MLFLCVAVAYVGRKHYLYNQIFPLTEQKFNQTKQNYYGKQKKSQEGDYICR